jgi:peroxiredoxin
MADKKQPITKGETAPDFTLKDQDNKEFTLSKQKGKRVLLSFQPLAWTPVCQNQMKGLEAYYDEIAALNTVPIGLSVDSRQSKKAWADSLGIKKLRMLADFWPHGAVAKAYGVFREADGHSERANVIVDETGKVAWIKVYDLGTLPDIPELIAALKQTKQQHARV